MASRSIFEKSSFFVLISGCHASLEEEISPFLSKWRSFTSSRRALLKETSGHFWRVDLTFQSEREHFHAEEYGKDHEIFVFTHVKTFYFDFRVFDIQGLERNRSFHYAGTCYCCLNCVPELNSRFINAVSVAKRFSIMLSRSSFKRKEKYRHYITVPKDVRNMMPFTSNYCVITLRLRTDSDSSCVREFRLLYAKRLSAGRYFYRLTNGWAAVERSCALEGGEKCQFSLSDEKNWVYAYISKETVMKNGKTRVLSR